MSDPIRFKKKGRIEIVADYKDVENPVRLYLNIHKEEIKTIPKDILQNILLEEVKKVALHPIGGMLKLNTNFNYQEPEFLNEFDYANTIIQVNLPYCLHVPNFDEMEVDIPELNLKANVIFEKIWTGRAVDGEEESDKVDFFAEDRDLYFNKGSMITPKLPLPPHEGWEGYYTGKNTEKMRDQNGVFRYTRLLIQFDVNTSEEVLNKEKDLVIEKIREKTIIIVNRVIDAYRTNSDEYHVRRLGEINIVLVYFIQFNQGYYILSPNTTNAKINISRQEIEKIKEKLLNADKPDLYQLFLLNAKSSLDTKDYTLAIVESFQALEMFLEKYLISEFKKRGDSESSYKKILKKHWTTKNRLNSVLKELKGKSLNEIPTIWDMWSTRYDKTRNEVIHGGKEPLQKESEETIDANQKVIDWVQSL